MFNQLFFFKIMKKIFKLAVVAIATMSLSSCCVMYDVLMGPPPPPRHHHHYAPPRPHHHYAPPRPHHHYGYHHWCDATEAMTEISNIA